MKKTYNVFVNGGFIGQVRAANKAAALRQVRSPRSRFLDWNQKGNKFTVVEERRNPAPKRHKRSSITLRNMKSVTIKRKADGTVEIRGTRKKARKR